MTGIITDNIGTIIPIVLTILAAIWGWFRAWVLTGKNMSNEERIRRLTVITKEFAKVTATYLRIRADGVITVEETDKLGDAMIDFFETVEKELGVQIFNSPDVPFILPLIIDTIDHPENIVSNVEKIISHELSGSPEETSADTKYTLPLVQDAPVTGVGTNTDKPSGTQFLNF